MKFADNTLSLLNQLNQTYPGSVILRGDGEATGILTHDQVSTDTLGTRLMIEVTDGTAPDFTATYEMLRMMLTLNGFPQVYFQLETDDAAITEQLMVMATYLYRPALNAIVYREQAKHGLLTDTVAKAFAKGVMTTLTKESATTQGEAALRLLTLLDAKVLMAAVPSDTTAYTAAFADAFPKAWAATDILFNEMQPSEIVDTFTMHQAIVTLFKSFDAIMVTWDLPELHNQDFTTVTPVLSERQLRLPVAQVFDIKHVDLKDHTTGELAYIGVQKASGQNSFVLSTPQEATADWFKALYALPVQDLFDQMKQPYSIRN
ncbi:MAG: IpaB/EvcA family protein [Lactobacillaceae bacterium]|jgi:hypothetical protein|nr:IpaB/EvcA family protein [Lactobacillaceae bacterium]